MDWPSLGTVVRFVLAGLIGWYVVDAINAKRRHHWPQAIYYMAWVTFLAVIVVWTKL